IRLAGAHRYPANAAATRSPRYFPGRADGAGDGFRVGLGARDRLSRALEWASTIRRRVPPVACGDGACGRSAAERPAPRQFVRSYSELARSALLAPDLRLTCAC